MQMLRSPLSVLSCRPCIRIDERAGLRAPSSEAGFSLCCTEHMLIAQRVSQVSHNVVRGNYEAIFSLVQLLYFTTLQFFFPVYVGWCWNRGGGLAQCWIKFLQAYWIFVLLLLYLFVCFVALHRMLHLAIIHEEEVIAQQLIQLFPKEVLDIQNNLYQVSVAIVALLFSVLPTSSQSVFLII